MKIERTPDGGAVIELTSHDLRTHCEVVGVCVVCGAPAQVVGCDRIDGKYTFRNLCFDCSDARPGVAL